MVKTRNQIKDCYEELVTVAPNQKFKNFNIANRRVKAAFYQDEENLYF